MQGHFTQFSSLRLVIKSEKMLYEKGMFASCWRNVSSDGEVLIVGGRSFHALAAAAGKARSPSVARRVHGTTSDNDRRHGRHGVDCQFDYSGHARIRTCLRVHPRVNGP